MNAIGSATCVRWWTSFIRPLRFGQMVMSPSSYGTMTSCITSECGAWKGDERTPAPRRGHVVGGSTACRSPPSTGDRAGWHPPSRAPPAVAHSGAHVRRATATPR
eukprot:15454997-Alexandrium_andersonii.AAC.1